MCVNVCVKGFPVSAQVKHEDEAAQVHVVVVTVQV